MMFAVMPLTPTDSVMVSVARSGDRATELDNAMIGVGGRNTSRFCTSIAPQIFSILGICGTGDRIGGIACFFIDEGIVTEGRSAL
ncbi:hypothetical protein [Oscillatoria acuminata]|uniref:hypothetical protein n=1 Tax=Oscillatoria acuminata TaxID=118323 RepID=UPI0003184D83|nr:hypothetical protein [Oscillatoria acuminata]